MASCDEETENLVQNVYANEKDPDTKADEQHQQQPQSVVDGVPLHPPPAASPPAATRASWSTGLFSCLGNNDDFCSSDLEVCVLGSCAPCLLFGSNMERLYPESGSTFLNHSLSYTGLLFLGNVIFGCNALAPCFSYVGRSEMRRQFQLMGTGEGLARSCGCSGSFLESEHRECIDSVGDLATHYLCHPCALCQEGREIRRRRPHPGLFRPFLAMYAPPEQQIMEP